MIQPIKANSLSFKRIYKYPYASYTPKQREAYNYVLDNVLLSEKYTDNKGRTLKESFDKLGVDIVAYPTNLGGITFETKHSKAELKTLKEVNKPYPNVTRAGLKSEEAIADMFKTKLENCKLEADANKREHRQLIAGAIAVVLGIAGICYMASHRPKTDKRIEQTVLKQDFIQETAKKAIDIFK